MAPERRPGDLSFIFVGRQKAYGERIIGSDVFDGAAPDWSNTNAIVPKLTRRHFPFVRNTLDANAETEASESIYGGGAPDSIITGRAGAGEWEFELLPDDAIHMLFGWFNPKTLPTNTSLADQAITVGAIASNAVNFTNAIANWPGKLRITPKKGSGKIGAGTLTVIGQKRGSRSNKFNAPVTEVIDVAEIASSDVGTTTIDTENFYYQANQLRLNFASDAPDDFDISFIPDTKWAELVINEGGATFDGWTTQMVKALQAYIGFDVVPNLFRLSIGTNIRLLLSLLASYVQESRSLVDPNVQTNVLSDLQTSDGILSKYPISSLDFYPSRGTAVTMGNAGESLDDLLTRIDGANPPEPIAVESVEIEGNHNYTQPPGLTGDPVGGQPATGDTETRAVTVTSGIYHEVDDAETDNKTVHWQDRFFEGRRVPIVIRNYNWLSNGRQVIIESRFPSCKLSEVPGMTIEGRATPTRNLVFEAKRSRDATNPDEISMRFYSQKGFEE